MLTPIGVFFFCPMVKPLSEKTFRPIEGVWRDVSGEYAGTLSDYLRELQIVVDDDCEFARIKQYDRHRSIWYRAYNYAHVTITIFALP